VTPDLSRRGELAYKHITPDVARLLRANTPYLEIPWVCHNCGGGAHRQCCAARRRCCLNCVPTFGFFFVCSLVWSCWGLRETAGRGAAAGAVPRHGLGSAVRLRPSDCEARCWGFGSKPAAWMIRFRARFPRSLGSGSSSSSPLSGNRVSRVSA